MNLLTLQAYGVHGGEVVIVVERITHFYPGEYNGRRGTVIVLDTGREVTVEESVGVVRLAVGQAR